MKRSFVFLLLIVVMVTLVVLGLFSNAPTTTARTNTQENSSGGPVVRQAVAFGISAPVRDIPKPVIDWSTGTPINRELNRENVERVKQIVPGRGAGAGNGLFVDPLLSNQPNIVASTPGPTLTFEGNSSADNDAAFGNTVMPPDTNGDVGPNHYVQMTNNLVRIWNKSGTPLTPPFKLTSITDVVGGPCRGESDGDPVVVYDPLADRWLLSQFCVAPVPGYEMIAISQTGDPTGAYYVYAFQMPNNDFYDYPHFGVWPDAYYMTTHDFNQAGTAYLGQGAFAFDRTKMLAGDPTASYIFFNENTPSICPSCGGQLPSDLDGYVPPPPGTPNLFMEFRADEFGVGEIDGLRIFAFSPNFSNPPASTFTRVGANDLALAAFDARTPSTVAPVEQPPPANPGTYLDAIADRFMFRLAYRNLGTQASPVNSYVGNFTVNTSGVDPTNAGASGYQAGIRWFELRRNPGSGAMSVFDQGTHSPDAGPASGANGANRWMGGIAQDNQGNIAVGYSRSSVTAGPDIVWAGRTGGAGGTLNETETLMFASDGVQLATNNRWGDYSDMTVDPNDDCTFWYTQEYRTLAGQVDPSPAGAEGFLWNTRIGSFKFPVCTAAPKGQIAATITNCNTSGAIQGATVNATGGFARTTNSQGNLLSNIIAPPGSYTVTASKAGFSSDSAMTTVTNGGTSNVAICLTPLSTLPVMSVGSSSLVTEACTPSNGAIDPGETVSVSLCVSNTGNVNTANLTGTLTATGGVTNPGSPQNYGIVPAGGAATCRTFTFKAANQSCGSHITATLALQDGSIDLGTVTYDFPLGVPAITFSQNFDGVTAPNLPAGWTATNSVTTSPTEPKWVSTTVSPASAPNAMFASEPAIPTDKMLDSPAFAVNSSAAKLSFGHNYDLESGFDGGVLEIKIGAGAFQDWIIAGGTFAANGYNGTISNSAANLSPIQGRSAWTGSSGGYLTTVANFPASAVGQMVQLRFRMGSDNQIGVLGWRVDNVLVIEGFTCCISSVCIPHNIALSSLGALGVPSTTHFSGGYPALSAIDGDRTGNNWGTSGGWADGTRGIYPDTFDVDFQGPRIIDEIDVFTLQNNWQTAGPPNLTTPATAEGILDFEVQMWTGQQWVTVPNGSVTNNDKAWRQFTFPAITTTKIRVQVNAARNNYSRIVEVEAIGCPP